MVETVQKPLLAPTGVNCVTPHRSLRLPGYLGGRSTPGWSEEELACKQEVDWSSCARPRTQDRQVTDLVSLSTYPSEGSNLLTLVKHDITDSDYMYMVPTLHHSLGRLGEKKSVLLTHQQKRSSITVRQLVAKDEERPQNSEKPSGQPTLPHPVCPEVRSEPRL